MHNTRQRRLAVTALATAVGTALVLWSSAASAAPAPAEVTDPATVLPVGITTDIVFDDTTAKVFIAQPQNNAVVVANRKGAVTGTVTDVPGATQLVLQPLSSALYVVGSSQPTITKINTRTLTKTTITLPPSVCADSITYTGGRLWFSYDPCLYGTTWGFGYVNPATNAVTTFPTSGGYPDDLFSLPGQPTRVVGFEAGFSGDPLDIWNLSPSGPTLVKANYTDGPGLQNCADAAFINGGAQVVLACGAPYQHSVYNTADASYNSAIPSNPYPNAVATSRDGTTLALGMNGIYDPDVIFQDVSGGLPGTTVSSVDFGYARSLATRGLAWSAAGLVYAIEYAGFGAANILHILRPAG